MGTRKSLLIVCLLLAALMACTGETAVMRDALSTALPARPHYTATRTIIPELVAPVASPELPAPGESPGAIAFKAELIKLLDWAAMSLAEVARQCPAHGAAACTYLYRDARRVLYEGMGTLRIPPNAVASLCAALGRQFSADWDAARTVMIAPIPLDPSGAPDAGAILDRSNTAQDQLAALRNVVLTQPGTCR
jgi:hypothetical protein